MNFEIETINIPKKQIWNKGIKKKEKKFNPCSVEGCKNHAPSKGLCEKHRGRFRKYGDSNKTTRIVERNISLEAKFHLSYEKQENGCWIWKIGFRPNSNGEKYGRITIENGKGKGAHRFSYELYFGSIPEKMCVCHKCDTPLCVNPEHLFLGTQKNNMEDCVEKGRINKSRGENKKSLSKLLNKQAEEIRKLNLPQSKIAETYKISQTAVSRIKRGVSY